MPAAAAAAVGEAPEVPNPMTDPMLVVDPAQSVSVSWVSPVDVRAMAEAARPRKGTESGSGGLSEDDRDRLGAKPVDDVLLFRMVRAAVCAPTPPEGLWLWVGRAVAGARAAVAGARAMEAEAPEAPNGREERNARAAERGIAPVFWRKFCSLWGVTRMSVHEGEFPFLSDLLMAMLQFTALPGIIKTMSS